MGTEVSISIERKHQRTPGNLREGLSGPLDRWADRLKCVPRQVAATEKLCERLPPSPGVDAASARSRFAAYVASQNRLPEIPFGNRSYRCSPNPAWGAVRGGKIERQSFGASLER
jgi:hypothetical protein